MSVEDAGHPGYNYDPGVCILRLFRNTTCTCTAEVAVSFEFITIDGLSLQTVLETIMGTHSYLSSFNSPMMACNLLKFYFTRAAQPEPGAILRLGCRDWM